MAIFAEAVARVGIPTVNLERCCIVRVNELSVASTKIFRTSVCI